MKRRAPVDTAAGGAAASAASTAGAASTPGARSRDSEPAHLHPPPEPAPALPAPQASGPAPPASGPGPQAPASDARQAAATVPGSWRLLAPALLCWLCAAALIHAPGTGKILAIAAGVCGLASCVLAARPRRPVGLRRQRSRLGGRLRGAAARPRCCAPRAATGAGVGAGVALLACALIIVLGTRIELLERARASPSLRLAAEHSRTVRVAATLAGYPGRLTGGHGGHPGSGEAAGAVAAGDRGWVRGHLTALDGEILRGAVPVIMWLPSAPPSLWHPGEAVWARGTLVPGPPEGASAYEVRVRDFGSGTERGDPASLAGALAAQLRVNLRAAAAETPGAELVPGLAIGDTSLVS